MSEAEAAVKAGAALESAKDFASAEARYRQALLVHPDYVPALTALGRLATRAGDDVAARFFLERAIRRSAPRVDVKLHRSMALACRRLGRLSEAEAHTRRALQTQTPHPDDQINLGNLLLAQGRPHDALAHHHAASVAAPKDPYAHYHLGLSLAAVGRKDAAIAAYRTALDFDPDFWPAIGNTATILSALGRYDDAETLLEGALARQGSPPRLFSSLAVVLKEKGDIIRALEACRRALQGDPSDTSALITEGVLFHSQDQLCAAALSFRKALALEPGSVDALFNLGNVMKDFGEAARAIALYNQALELKPSLAAARFARCTALLAPIYDSHAQMSASRSAYRKALDDLSALAEGPLAATLADGVGSSQPFYLAYQGQNDRDLQALYGQIVAKAAGHAYASPPFAQIRSSQRIKVAVVSGYFRRHANWALPIKGWLTQLDRVKFELIGYHTGLAQDDVTAEARALCDRFVQAPLSLEEWRASILSHAPDVLIFPEVGMDPVSTQLAATRLARVQCVSWGHPTTSGLPTIDYFLSSDLMEPADAQTHYTETLVRLPNLSVFCEPLKMPARLASRRDLGLPETDCLYWCGQALQKYLPANDEVFARIAEKTPHSRFIFIVFPGGPALTQVFRDRMNRAFHRVGLKADAFCVFLPRLAPEAYAAALSLSDVYLDSIGWSGCNSTFEALTFNLPIVTLPGAMMRSRHTSAMLTMMGTPETVAKDLDDYVSIAADLGGRPEVRGAASQRIGRSKHRIYSDKACILGLETFLVQAAHLHAG